MSNSCVIHIDSLDQIVFDQFFFAMRIYEDEAESPQRSRELFLLTARLKQAFRPLYTVSYQHIK